LLKRMTNKLERLKVPGFHPNRKEFPDGCVAAKTMIALDSLFAFLPAYVRFATKKTKRIPVGPRAISCRRFDSGLTRSETPAMVDRHAINGADEVRFINRIWR